MSPPSRKVTVEPGLAIDCTGNEILVPKMCGLDVVEAAKCCVTPGEESNARGELGEGPRRLYVVVEYCETATDPVPVLSTNRTKEAYEYSRIGDGYRFSFKCEGELPTACPQVRRWRCVKREAHGGADYALLWDPSVVEPSCCECPLVVLAAIEGEVDARTVITGDMIRGQSRGHEARHPQSCR
jgi:hypothetical protein